MLRDTIRLKVLKQWTTSKDLRNGTKSCILSGIVICWIQSFYNNTCADYV